MKKGKPRYRIICDAKGFDEPLVVGWHSYFGYYLVDSFEDELKITKDDVYATGSDCLRIMRLLRDIRNSLEGTDDNAYSNFRVTKIWYDKNTNTQIFENVNLDDFTPDIETFEAKFETLEMLEKAFQNAIVHEKDKNIER